MRFAFFLAAAVVAQSASEESDLTYAQDVDEESVVMINRPKYGNMKERLMSKLERHEKGTMGGFNARMEKYDRGGLDEDHERLSRDGPMHGEGKYDRKALDEDHERRSRGYPKKYDSRGRDEDHEGRSRHGPRHGEGHGEDTYDRKGRDEDHEGGPMRGEDKYDRRGRDEDHEGRSRHGPMHGEDKYDRKGRDEDHEGRSRHGKDKYDRKGRDEDHEGRSRHGPRHGEDKYDRRGRDEDPRHGPRHGSDSMEKQQRYGSSDRWAGKMENARQAHSSNNDKMRQIWGTKDREFDEHHDRMNSGGHGPTRDWDGMEKRSQMKKKHDSKYGSPKPMHPPMRPPNADMVWVQIPRASLYQAQSHYAHDVPSWSDYQDEQGSDEYDDPEGNMETMDTGTVTITASFETDIPKPSAEIEEQITLRQANP